MPFLIHRFVAKLTLVGVSLIPNISVHGMDYAENGDQGRKGYSYHPEETKRGGELPSLGESLAKLFTGSAENDRESPPLTLEPNINYFAEEYRNQMFTAVTMPSTFTAQEKIKILEKRQRRIEYFQRKKEENSFSPSIESTMANTQGIHSHYREENYPMINEKPQSRHKRKKIPFEKDLGLGMGLGMKPVVEKPEFIRIDAEIIEVPEIMEAAIVTANGYPMPWFLEGFTPEQQKEWFIQEENKIVPEVKKTPPLPRKKRAYTKQPRLCGSENWK